MEREQIGTRLKELRGGMSPPELAKALGVTRNTVAYYERGERFPDVKYLWKILDLFKDVNPAWLLSGEPPRVRGGASQLKGFVCFPPQEFQSTQLADHVAQSGQVVDFVAFREDWIVGNLEAGPKDLALIAAKGDSMQPTLGDGDLALVDLRCRRIDEDSIYVLDYQSFLAVKRVQRQFDGSVVIKNDNPLYGPEKVDKAQVSSLGIIGKVIWKAGN